MTLELLEYAPLLACRSLIRMSSNRGSTKLQGENEVM